MFHQLSKLVGIISIEITVILAYLHLYTYIVGTCTLIILLYFIHYSKTREGSSQSAIVPMAS